MVGGVWSARQPQWRVKQVPPRQREAFRVIANVMGKKDLKPIFTYKNSTFSLL